MRFHGRLTHTMRNLVHHPITPALFSRSVLTLVTLLHDLMVKEECHSRKLMAELWAYYPECSIGRAVSTADAP